MSTDPGPPTGRFVEPDRQMARTLGILNIVFGILLLLGCNVWGGGMSLLFALGAPLLDKAVEKERSELQRRVEKLQEEEQASEDEDQRADLARSRERLEQQVRQMPHFSKFADGFSTRESIAYLVIDQLLGVPLNLAMIVGGIGVVSLRPWGRTLTLWTMVLKIVRLLPQELFYTIVVAPQWARALSGFIVSMMPPGQAPPGFEAQITASYLGMYVGMGVAILFLGPIYPAICIWLLTRAKVKTAFLRPQNLPPAPR